MSSTWFSVVALWTELLRSCNLALVRSSLDYLNISYISDNKNSADRMVSQNVHAIAII